MNTLTPDTLALFVEYAKDAGEWGGCPLVGGNVRSSMENNGRITALKKAGLVSTFEDEGTYMEFTPDGVALARQHGVKMEDYDEAGQWQYAYAFRKQ